MKKQYTIQANARKRTILPILAFTLGAQGCGILEGDPSGALQAAGTAYAGYELYHATKDEYEALQRDVRRAERRQQAQQRQRNSTQDCQ